MRIHIETIKGHHLTSDIDWESVEYEIAETNRGMGDEYVHHCYVDLLCPICQCHITRVDVYEYPQNTFNKAIGYYDGED